MSFSTPIALCIFNRPEPLRRVFGQIRRLQPRYLYIFGDGPRLGHPRDQELIRAAQAVVSNIDWDCEVRTNYATQNMGCRRRISSGISWAFNFTDRLIVLEDDCLPHPSFFRYCETLLERYEHRPEVMAISGNNFQLGPRTHYSYYFSKFPHCWGWATWKQAWERMDLGLAAWPELRQQAWLEQISDVQDEVDYWRDLFDLQHAGKLNSWAFPWMFSCWRHQGLTILPERNLVSNIGFGSDATHTEGRSELENLPRFALGRWRHPPEISRHRVADIHSFYRLYFQPAASTKWRHRLRQWMQVRRQWERWQYMRKSA